MSKSDEVLAKRPNLSPERRALLEQRLQDAVATVRATPLTIPARSWPRADISAPRTEVPLGLGDSLMWEALVEAGREKALVASRDSELCAQAAAEPRVDRLSEAYICLALRHLGVFVAEGERHTIEDLIGRCHIVPGYRKVLVRWLTMLEEEGLLHRDGVSFVSLCGLPSEHLESLLSDDEKADCGRNLTALLRGERHPLELLIPDGSSDDIEREYVELPMFRFCNAVSTALLAQFVGALGADSALRILEIGAGTGGTTAALLPLLPAARTTYVYTDISRFFIERAQERFRDYDFIEYGKLNIELDPRNQGYQPHSFNLVIAAHVLHATRLIKETIKHVRSMMVPGAALLLLEETRFRRLFNFGMGFMPGFDRFEDYELRRDHPLLTSEQWCELLLSHGFDKVASFVEPGSPASVLGVDVILARACDEVPKA